jgi:hypothetical protein
MEIETEDGARVRHRLREYVTTGDAPEPLIARDLLVAGRKLRRRRRVSAAAIVAGVVTTTCVVAALVVTHGDGTAGQPEPRRVDPATATARPPATPPAGPQVRLTDAEAIARYTSTFRTRLEKMLPGAPEDAEPRNYWPVGQPFQFSVAAKHDKGYGANAVPATAAGKGTIRVTVWPSGNPEPCEPADDCEVRHGRHGERIEVGSDMSTGRAENHAMVFRPDGSEVVVRAWAATAEDYAGTSPDTSPTPVLSRDQAAALAADAGFTLYR